MSRTRIVFFVVVLAAVLIVAGSFVVRWLGQQEGVVTVPSTETLEVRIVCALPVEPWVREAAKQFNEEKHKLEGQPIEVSVIPMDGLTAMGRYEREEMDPLPTAWIPDSRYLVELVNAAYKEKLGRDSSSPTGNTGRVPSPSPFSPWASTPAALRCCAPSTAR